ncbi:NUDIX domain-containing protein [Pseudorhodoferax sp.]|uniref:NUDIX domain-containing protein n=1 Tax=Pseudorhodoferax sp. TaxID=1993553 RepID=UPI002DD65F6F|nr:NUDIX domain-containing protein [Pseudorhodoferax sp.]
MSIAHRMRVLDVQTLSQRWNRLLETTLDYQRSDGRWQTMRRETADHGSAAAVLLYHRARRSVVLVRQFRYAPVLDGHDALMLEVPAGLLDDASPEDTVRAEAEQEAGYRVRQPQAVFKAYASPGSLTECVHCFVAEVDDDDRISAGGGLEHEGEDIEVLEVPFDDAMAMLADGRICDAKTIMLLQHAALHVFGAAPQRT